MAERCVCCGAIIPEGRQVCPNCENAPLREKLIELIFSTPRELSIGMRNGKSFMSVAKIADHLIANGVTVQKWIPVTERLPEHTDGHVLVTDGNQVKISCRNALYKTANGEVRCAQGYGSGMPVTHWMPLPEPPKGE